MANDSKNRREDGPKCREKELFLLSPYMHNFMSEIDDKFCLVKAGKSLRQELGQCLTTAPLI